MAFTYDLTTNRGQTRLLIPDTVEASALFTDEEIDWFLTQETTPKLAAALAWEILARDRSKLAAMVTLGQYSTREQAAKDLLEMARAMRAQAGGGLQIGTLAASDDKFESYRPEWRSAGDDPVVE